MKTILFLGIFKSRQTLDNEKIDKQERVDFCSSEAFSYIALYGYRRKVWKFNVPIQSTQFNNGTIHSHCMSSNLKWTERYLFKNATHRNWMGSDSIKNSKALAVPKGKTHQLCASKRQWIWFLLLQKFFYKDLLLQRFLLFFSIVLSALVDYDYKLIYVDVGCLGRISDVGVYRNSSLCKVLSKGTLNLPRPRPPPNVEWKSPYKWQWNQRNFIFICSRWCFPP